MAVPEQGIAVPSQPGIAECQLRALEIVGGFDYVAVVTQANRTAGDDSQRNHGQWRPAWSNGSFSQAEFDCYLDIAGHLSGVFIGASELDGERWAPTAGLVNATLLDSKGVPLVLSTAPGTRGSKLQQEQLKPDRSLLAACLSFADGAWEWDTPSDDGGRARPVDLHQR